jgi:hypothetical protein
MAADRIRRLRKVSSVEQREAIRIRCSTMLVKYPEVAIACELDLRELFAILRCLMVRLTETALAA